MLAHCNFITPPSIALPCQGVQPQQVVLALALWLLASIERHGIGGFHSIGTEDFAFNIKTLLLYEVSPLGEKYVEEAYAFDG